MRQRVRSSKRAVAGVFHCDSGKSEEDGRLKRVKIR